MRRSGEPRQLRANSLARPAVQGRLVSLGARHGLVKDAAAAVTEARGACPFAASLPLASSRTRTHCRFANALPTSRPAGGEGGISHEGGREEAAAREACGGRTRARRGDRGIVSCERPACEHANNRGRPRSSVEGTAGRPVRAAWVSSVSIDHSGIPSPFADRTSDA
jgi:hypothetical protein